MYRLLKAVLVTLIFSAVLFTGCRKNRAPDKPSTPAGPTSGAADTEHAFASSAEDADDDSVAVRFDWGDGDTSDWSDWQASGDSISMFHSWSDSGSYSIRAQAQDLNEAVSSWSGGHQVVIGAAAPANNPPNTPTTPRGASTGLPDVPYSFVSRATDPDGDSIAMRFDWGEGKMSDWSDWQASGDSISMSHSWSDYGTYTIKAQTKDEEGDTSCWSTGHLITVSPGWTKTFGGSSDDYGESVQQTSDGGYIIAGYTVSYGSGGYDVYLVRTDAHGDTLWTKTFGGPDDDYGYSVRQTSDGGYIVAGYTVDVWGLDDVCLVKTDANGNQTWYKTLGGGDTRGYSVQQTRDGGYIIAGSILVSIGGNLYRRVYLVKTDANGKEIWHAMFGGDNYSCGYSVQQTSNGGYIVVGYSDWSPYAQDYQVYLNKTDSRGNREWYERYGGYPERDEGHAVQQTADDGYIIAGMTQSHGAGSNDVYLIKTDAFGVQRWYKTFGTGGDDGGWSVQQTSDGGYIIAGYTQQLGYYDVWLIKTDASGNKQWEQIIGGSDKDTAHSCQQTSDGGYILVGHTLSHGAGGADVYLIKTDANGNVE